MNSALTSFIEIGLWIDNVIYSGIGLVYELLIKIANYEIFSQETIGEFSTRIYALLGIFMLFKLTFSLITYVVNPDDMADKSKGMAAIGKNVIISLILILLVPYIFAEAYNLQNIILREHTLENIVFGTQNRTTDIDSAGKIIQYNLFSQFVKPNYDDIESISDCRVIYYDKDGKGTYDMATDPESGEESLTTYMLNPDCFGENNEGGPLEQLFKDADGEVYFENYKAALADQNYRLLVNTPEVYTLKVEVRENGKAVKYSVINYQFLLSTAIGVVVLLILINFCMDIAVRSIKLAFYQIIAPIPIISLCDPKSSKSGMFSKWVKACFTTYLGLFIRLVALYLAIFIITAVVKDTEFKGVATIFIIIGALIFAKELPKIITDITGIKMDGKFTLNPFKKFENEALGGQRFSGAVGGMVAGAVGGGRGFFGRLGGAFTGAARGFADGKGYESGLAKQADVNRKLREARINGYTGVRARIAASASRYGLDDVMLEAEATKLRKNKDAIDVRRKAIDSGNKAFEVEKKAYERAISPKQRVIAKQEAVKSSIKTMEDTAVDYIKKGKAGTFTTTYQAYQALGEHFKNMSIGAKSKITVRDTNGETIITKGEKLTAEQQGKIINLADKYAGKEGKEGLMKELLKASDGVKSDNVGANDVSAFKASQAEYISAINSANELIREYNSGNLTNGVPTRKDASGNIVVDIIAEIKESDEYSNSSTNNGVHDQFGALENAIKYENIDIKEAKDKIESLENKIKANLADAKVEYDGVEISLEEAERKLKEEQERIDKLKQQSKVNRDAAAASKINWNGK